MADHPPDSARPPVRHAPDHAATAGRGLADDDDYSGVNWRDLSSYAANLDPRQVRAVLLRCDGSTPAQIATTIGVSLRTVFRWFERDDVSGFYADVSGALFRSDVAEIQALRSRAIRALGAALDVRPVEPHTVRAAKEVLDRTGIPAVKEVRKDDVAGRDPRLADLPSADVRRLLRVARGEG